VEENNKQFFIIRYLKMAALVAIFSFTGCSQYSPEIQNPEVKKKDSLLPERNLFFNNEVLPEAIRLAETGDIVTRMGTDISSLMLSKINPTDPSYSHCGIISIEQDTAFVYHTIGGELNPDQKMRRDPLLLFAQPADCKRLGIFSTNLTDGQKQALAILVNKLYLNGLPFDMEFNLETNDKQYCSEMVAKSIGNIMGKMDWVSTLNYNNISFIPVENIYHNRYVREKKRFVY
jgi:Permuted papain-like amidase enzyme, YaeF/YiiX, C92 family